MASEPDGEDLIKQLLAVENTIRDHYQLYQSTMEDHRAIIDRLWVLAQRYTIITRDVTAKCTNPPNSTHQIEDEIRTEFCIKHNLLSDSNSKLMSSISNLQNIWSTIDQSPTAFQQPIAYFMEIFADYIKFFTHIQSKLNCFAMLLAPDNVSSLERYRKLLQPNKEFDYHFSVSTAHCNCLRANKTEKT